MANLLKWGEAKYVLVSYYYLREKGEKYIERILRDFDHVFLDSGAFTWRQHIYDEVLDELDEEYYQKMEEYIQAYINFINIYGEEFDLVTEIDVGNWQQKTRYRDRLEAEVNKKVTLLPVYHRPNPPIYLDYLCSKYPYVAFGSMKSGRTNKGLKEKTHKRLIRAKKYGTLTHGFAMTVVDIMKFLPLTSVDSASWIHGAKHGMTFWFDGKHLHSYDKFEKWNRVRLKEEVKNLGLSWDEFMDDKAKVINMFNLAQWVKFQKFLDGHGTGIGKFKESQEKFTKKGG